MPGRGRRGPIDQIQKKPQIRKDKQRGKAQWWHFDGPNYDKNKNSVFLPEDFVDMMKRMNPLQPAKFLNIYEK